MKKKSQLKSYEKDKTFVDINRTRESYSQDQKEEAYENWRKKIEDIVASMKGCSNPKLMTRRDLMAKGILASTAAVFGPRFNFIDSAYAQASGMSTVGVLNLGGSGGTYFKDMVPSGPDGAGIASAEIRTAYGAPAGDNPANYVSFAGVSFFPSSPIITTLQTVLGANFAAISANSLLLHSPVIRPDDTGNAKVSGTALMAAALGSGVSTSAIQTNGGGYTETHTNPVSPLIVASAADAAKLPGAEPVGFLYQTNYPGKSVEANAAVMAALNALSKRGIEVSKNLADEVKAVAKGSSDTMADKFTKPSPFVANPDLAADAAMLSQVFPNAATGGVSAGEMQAAKAVVHCLTNKAGGIGATVGRMIQSGCDSHNNNGGYVANQIWFGQVIARALLVAFNRQSRFAITFDGDGSQFMTGLNGNVSLNPGDDGTRSTAFVLIYDPTGRPEVNNTDSLAFTGYTSVSGNGRPVPPNTPIANDPATFKEVCMLNILASFGMLGRWDKVPGTKLTVASAKSMGLLKVKDT